MPQNKNFIAARLPQELYDRLDSHVEGKKGEKTKIIIQAIAAYLDFPLKATDTATNNEERFIALENRITELEQQLEEFKKFVIKDNLFDNITEVSIITNDNSVDSSDNSIKPDINIDNGTDNKKISLVPLQDDGSLGPAPEAQIANFMGIKVTSLRYYRKNLKESGKPLNQPKRVEYNNKPYDLICLGESKFRGKSVLLWIANPVIEADNNVYQADIIYYQPDNNLLNTLNKTNQEEQKQDSKNLELDDNTCNQELSLELDLNQGSSEQHPQDSLPNDNSSYQKLSAEFDSNEELSQEQQDSGKQSSTQHQPELSGEEQPDF